MSSIFDVLEEREPRGGQEGFFDLAAQEPEKKEVRKPSFLEEASSTMQKFKEYSPALNTALDLGKASLKGGIEGLQKFGQAFGPLQGQKDTTLEDQVLLDELLPTEGGFAEDALRRGISEAPVAMATMGAGGLPRALIAGFMGEGAKELGAPEWAQTALELTAYAGPDITKKLLSSGSNKELIDFAKKMGLSDEQITPLIQSDFKQKWLTKISPKRGMTQEALAESKKGIDTVFSYFRDAGSKASIPENVGATMLNEMSALLKQMPAEVRGKIEKDAIDLIKSKPTANALFNFWADINYNAGNNAKQLSLLKEPIRKALKQIDPELAEEFRKGNKLAENYYKISAKLKPNLTSDLVSAGEALGILGSLATGYYPYFAKIAGEKAARQFAQQLLINPRLQQLGEKTILAVNEGKGTVAYKLFQGYLKELQKKSPEIAEKLRDLDEQDFVDFINSTQSEREKNIKSLQ